MRILLILLTAIGLAACGSNLRTKPAEISQSNRVEVLSFHSKQRCPTCNAIEHLAREVIEVEFAARLADSTLVFRVVAIADNEFLADHYQVTWSSLLISKWDDGSERVTELTKFAFANARTNPERFKAGLRAEIEKLLNE